MNTQQKHAYGPTTTESEDNQNIENHTIFQFLTTPMVSSAGHRGLDWTYGLLSTVLCIGVYNEDVNVMPSCRFHSLMFKRMLLRGLTIN